MSQSTPTLSTLSYGSINQYLFSRTYSIAIGAPKQTFAFQFSNLQVPAFSGTSTQPSNPNLPAPIRVTFDIDKNLVGTSNKSKFELYNLAYQTRNQIKKGYIVQIQAGYRGLMNTIFIGNIDDKGGVSIRKGSEIITTMECGEGESSIVMSVLDKSYPAGTQIVSVLQDLAAAMNLNSVSTDGGVGVGLVFGIPAVSFGRGITVHGTCKHSLDKILKPLGLRWSIQNNNLNIVPVTNANSTTAVVVSSGAISDASTGLSKFVPGNATGLIGTPSLNANNFLQFSSLLNPNIIPGGYVQLISENNALNGFWKVVRAHYMGDTHSDKWQVDCEATKISATAQTLNKGLNFSPAVQTGSVA